MLMRLERHESGILTNAWLFVRFPVTCSLLSRTAHGSVCYSVVSIPGLFHGCTFLPSSFILALFFRGEPFSSLLTEQTENKVEENVGEKEEFRTYLKKSGVIDALTKSDSSFPLFPYRLTSLQS